MKTILTIVFALLLTLSIPAGSALALGVYDPIPIQIINPTGSNPNQGVINSLNGVSNAINAQTQATQDAQLQQQLAALDLVCVTRETAQIRATDGSIQTNKMIADYRNNTMAHMDLSNPANVADANAYIKYLYTYITAQTTQLNNALIKDCQKTTTMQVQQTAPATVLQCNGKSWTVCPAGTTFTCPSTGDAQCLLPTPQTVTAQTTNQTVTQEQPKTAPPAIKAKTVVANTSLVKPKMHTVANPVASTSKDATQPTITPAPAKKGLWAWFKGLFGF